MVAPIALVKKTPEQLAYQKYNPRPPSAALNTMAKNGNASDDNYENDDKAKNDDNAEKPEKYNNKYNREIYE